MADTLTIMHLLCWCLLDKTLKTDCQLCMEIEDFRAVFLRIGICPSARSSSALLAMYATQMPATGTKVCTSLALHGINNLAFL